LTVTGTEYEKLVTEIMSMGFERDMVGCSPFHVAVNHTTPDETLQMSGAVASVDQTSCPKQSQLILV
jgi:hypothetical protein